MQLDCGSVTAFESLKRCGNRQVIHFYEILKFKLQNYLFINLFMKEEDISVFFTPENQSFFQS